jgi:hypothetical protein
MPRPRKSTLDAWLDTFSDWTVEDQEASLELCVHILRIAKRRNPVKKKTDKTSDQVSPAGTMADPEVLALGIEADGFHNLGAKNN